MSFFIEYCKYVFTAFSLKEIKNIFIDTAQRKDVLYRVCIDEENGHDIDILNTGSTLKSIYGDCINIMAGNIGSAKSYPEYCKARIDYVRVGFCTGSLASKDNGFYSPMASLLLDITGTKQTMLGVTKCTKIIADGGIADSVDILKCLALGADYVMCGRQFVKLLEASGTIMKKDDNNGGNLFEVTKEEAAQLLKQHGSKADLYRIYYGEHNPGLSSSVKVTGTLNSWLSDLQNKFSYAFMLSDATDWKTYKNNKSLLIL